MNKQKGLPLRSFSAEGGQTGILILVGIVILIAVSGGIFYLGRITTPKPPASTQRGEQPQNISTPSPQPSPIPDETVYTEASRSANWKTYKNNRFNFSFSYPWHWELEDYTSEEEKTYQSIQTIILSSQDKATLDYGFSIDIIIFSNPDDLSIDEFAPKIIPTDKKFQFQDINLNGVTAKQILNYSSPIEGGFIFIKKGKYIIYISGVYADIKAYKDIFDKFLSTFTYLP